MHPILLAGVAVLGLPVLLHLLLRQQPKKLVFPAMRFLKLRQRSSQRRVQLKHILLLVLRCLLLALFALALFQPVLSLGGTANPFGDEPVAAVLVIDTSPSMGYRDGTTTRLEEARRRAKDLLDQLPPNSKVAVLPTHDPTGTWQPTTLEAEQRIDALTEPSGSAKALGPALAAAYDLLASADAEQPEGSEPLVKLIAVFGDGTASSWDARDVSGLKAKRDALPVPPSQVYFNVGLKPPATPNNLAVADVRMDTDRLSGAADAVVTAMIRADGADTPGQVAVSARLDEAAPETVPVSLSPGQTQPVTFSFRRPAPGFHTVRVKIELENGDALPFDNERLFTFEVQARRRILAIADRPSDVTFWQDAHNFGPQEFDCEVKTPDAVPPLAPYEMVAVIAVADPKPFAQSLRDYVAGGGKVLLAPDGPNSETDTNRPAAYEALGLLPASIGEVKTFDKLKEWPFGRPWKIDEEADLRPQFFAPIRDWQKRGDVDIFRNRRITAKYRTLGAGNADVLAKYVGEQGTPALVERTSGKGRVMLLTTRLDNAAGDDKDFWNDFWVRENSSWTVVFPWLVTKYLCEQGTDAGGSANSRRYNFATGSEVPVGVRGFAPANGDRRLRLEGPGIAAAKSRFTLPADATTLTVRNKSSDTARLFEGVAWDLEGDPLNSPGTFDLKPDGVESPWLHRFSLAVPPAESDLSPLPDGSVGELFGPDSVWAVDRQMELDQLIQLKKKSTFDLFPVLILLVLILFAVEGVLANRFYKLK